MWWEHTLTVTRHEKVYWNDENVLKLDFGQVAQFFKMSEFCEIVPQ